MKGKIVKIILVVFLCVAAINIAGFIIYSIYPPESNPLSYPLITNYKEINFSINKNFEFREGEKFMYENLRYLEAYRSSGSKEAQIDELEQEYYLVKESETSDGNFIIVDEKNVSENIDIGGVRIYNNAGNLKETYTCTKDGKSEGTNFDEYFFINRWMLGLEENKSFKIEWTEILENRTLDMVLEFTVIGKENINGRECYKVKMIAYSPHYADKNDVYYYWIDAEKRILVKMEEWNDNGFKQFEKNILF